MSNLTQSPPTDYLLGANDVLEIQIAELNRRDTTETIRATVGADRLIHLPHVGYVTVGDLSVNQATEAITKAYTGKLVQPSVSVSLIEKGTIDVVVLGEVNAPGTYELPRFQNDVGHALAAAGGITPDGAELVEVHRRMGIKRLPPENPNIAPTHLTEGMYGDPRVVHQIPLRGCVTSPVHEQNIILRPCDVVIVPSRRDEVFYVVGRLSNQARARFTIGDQEREMGAGFLLPRERDVDVVTAVAMAGYIDPIDSPTTVTVHRRLPDGSPMLIKVDLIRARYDKRETINIMPGDIVYLNPDPSWYFRTTFDRLLPSISSLSYRRLLGLGGAGSNN